jgi:hypothetical protein
MFGAARPDPITSRSAGRPLAESSDVRAAHRKGRVAHAGRDRVGYPARRAWMFRRT